MELFLVQTPVEDASLEKRLPKILQGRFIGHTDFGAQSAARGQLSSDMSVRAECHLNVSLLPVLRTACNRNTVAS